MTLIRSWEARLVCLGAENTYFTWVGIIHKVRFQVQFRCTSSASTRNTYMGHSSGKPVAYSNHTSSKIHLLVHWHNISESMSHRWIIYFLFYFIICIINKKYNEYIAPMHHTQLQVHQVTAATFIFNITRACNTEIYRLNKYFAKIELSRVH